MKKLLFILPLALFLGACTYPEGSHTEQQKKMEENQQRLQSTYEVPQLEKSLEVENNHRRLEFLNKSDQVGYVYLLSYGNVISFYTIRGKVSSLNSYSTAMEMIVNADGVPCYKTHGDDVVTPSCSSGSGYIVQAPDIDGSYGQNVEGVYFFTTDNIYVEWKGEYLYTSEPLRISQPVQLTREIK